MNRQAFVSRAVRAVGGGVATNLDSVPNRLTAWDSCPRAVSASKWSRWRRDDHTKDLARRERWTRRCWVGYGKTKFPPWTATDIGQLKSLAAQKAGGTKIAKALNRTPVATTVRVHMHMLDVSL